MKFFLLESRSSTPNPGKSIVYLTIDKWNDYSYITQFYAQLYDSSGALHALGLVKIGFHGQTKETSTHKQIGVTEFTELGGAFFSLGESSSYYSALSKVEEKERLEYLESLNDLVSSSDIKSEILEEGVFKTALLRSLSMYDVKHQFKRCLKGLPELSDFKFTIKRQETDKLGKVKVSFSVNRESKPSSNMHALIGRNGVGKTQLLNGIVNAIAAPKKTETQILEKSRGGRLTPIDDAYFNTLLSISYSAFDPFEPPSEQKDPTKGTCYYYVGLKKTVTSNDSEASKVFNKSGEELRRECLASLWGCLEKPKVIEGEVLWLRSLSKLHSDENFAEMNLESLYESSKKIPRKDSEGKELDTNVREGLFIDENFRLLNRLSSGHLMVLLTITKMVQYVGEKTLVLIDEPECYLHPPLLSALLRATEDLLRENNAIAIIATHSPVVLQEIPQNCIWKIDRVGKDTEFIRPITPTFGESVSTLTHEVFGLEVRKSGFYDILKKEVESGKGLKEIVKDYDEQLGLEAITHLAGIIANNQVEK